MTTAVAEPQTKSTCVAKNQKTENVLIPEYRITHKEEAYEIRVELPGVSEDALDIHLEDRWLILKACPETFDEEGFTLVHSEFGGARYEVGFKVSGSIDSTQIKAQLQDGILTLTLPKVQELLRRSIEVTTG